MKSALLLISALMVILLLPAGLTAINDFRMTDHTELHVVTTVAPDTTGDVTLTQDLFNTSVVNAEVSSNNTLDAPLAQSYASATNVLTVAGLQTDAIRTLTIVYKIDALSDYFGAQIGTKVWPLFLILGVIGLIVAAVYNATKRGE